MGENPSFIFIHKGLKEEEEEEKGKGRRGFQIDERKRTVKTGKQIWKRKEKKKLPSTAKFVELAAGGEDDQSHFRIAKNRQFISLFQESVSAF